MNTESEGGEKPKIIIDEDWKSQVEAEKKSAAEKPGGQDAAAAGEPSSPTEESSGQQAHGESGQLPPASFSMLVTSLATQALAALGQLADPETGQPLPAQPAEAKHVIDTLGVLQDKSRGNLSPQEAALLEDSLHQLRMIYVAVSKGQS